MGVTKQLIAYIFSLAVSFTAVAQSTPEVHKINGKKYYLHIVEKGNTMYGISRQYKVDIDQIEKANQEALSDGLKVNQTLLIPVIATNKKELAPVEQSSDYLIHSVQPKETLYSISKSYNTPLEKILKANPEIEKEGLKADSEIKIPTKSIAVDDKLTAPAELDSLLGHVVKPGETAYSIAKQYGVDIKDLLEANKNTSELRVGSIVRIPGTSVKEEISIDTLTADSVNIYIPDSTGTYHIGLLLPISPQFPDSILSRDFRINQANRVAVDYLRGFRYAIDSLDKHFSVKLVVQVFPVLNDSASMLAALNSPNFDSLDIVIGPFYSGQFEYVCDQLKERGVPVICPINKPSKILFKRPSATKLVPSESMQIHGLAEFLASESIDSNLVLINSNKFQDTQNLDFFKQEIAKAVGQSDTVTDDVIPEIKLWDINAESLNMRFKDSGNYILVVPSNDQVFVTRLLGGLYDFMVDASGKFSFQVYGLQSWRNWEDGLSLRHLQALNVTIPISDYSDIQDYKVNGFYKAYYAENQFEPSAFTITGFDHCGYLYTQLSNNPIAWFESPEDFEYEGLLTNIKLRRVLEDSGVENEFISFYQYNNYRMKKTGSWPLTKIK